MSTLQRSTKQDYARTLASAALRALRENRPDDAQRLAAQISQVNSSDPNGPFIRAIVAYRRQQYEAAADLLKLAASKMPSEFRHHVEFWLGNVERARNRLVPASKHYRRVLELVPGHADAMFNLALTVRDLGAVDQAGLLFARAGRLMSPPFEASQVTVASAAALARKEKTPPSPPPDEPYGATTVFISFIVCSITPAKLDALSRNLGRCLDGKAWELIHISDAKSLCEGYTRGALRAVGELLVFCHDDIEIVCDGFHRRLINACEGADVVGVTGTTLVSGPAVPWSGSPHVHGRVTHIASDGKLLPSISSLASARVDRAQAIDGLFIATWRHVVERLGFDAETFSGFHFYDIDFSYRAFRAGLNVRIQSDIALIHHSAGVFGSDYWRYADRFLAKFPEIGRDRKRGAAAFFQDTLDNLTQLRCFHRWIEYWLD